MWKSCVWSQWVLLKIGIFYLSGSNWILTLYSVHGVILFGSIGKDLYIFFSEILGSSVKFTGCEWFSYLVLVPLKDMVFIVCEENIVPSSKTVELRSINCVWFEFVSIGCVHTQ